MEEKKCTGCQTVKPVGDFSKWSRGKDGYQNYCKLCNRGYLKKFNVDYLPKRRNGDQSKTGSYLHHIFLKMHDRCKNPDGSHWDSYGGRGISVCERWTDWELFKEDMMEGYIKGLSIERIDVNGNYSPENCKWIPKEDQGLNKRDTVRITVDGETVGLTEYCRQIGFSESTAYARYRKVGDDYFAIFKEYELIQLKSFEVKKFIADNFNRNTAYIIGEVGRLFGQKLSQQYVRQIKSDWKVGKEKSTLKKLFGDFESYVYNPLTATSI